MHLLYLISVWFHILAATLWLGGMGFLVLVVVPWMRRGNRQQGAVLLRETGLRFRTLGWVCFAVLAVTGTYNSYVRGVRFESFANESFLTSTFGRALLLKLVLFVVVLALSAYHDFKLGPDATRALTQEPASPRAESLRRRASSFGRLNALLALVLYGVAVVLVRGC